MERSLRQIDASVHWTQEVSLDIVSQTITRSRIESVLAGLGVSELRVRKLTMVMTVLFCIAMNLFTEEALDAVMGKLVAAARFLRPENDLEAAGASAICQRPKQLGVAPMVGLYKEVCRPMATSQTRDAFLFGLRLMAIDGTVENVADTPANSSYFGRHRGSRGESAFPQMRCVYLCECGTHAICDAGAWSYKVDERKGGLRMLRSVGPGMLVLWDCGFHSFDMAERCFRQQKAHFLGRVPAYVVFQPVRSLPDGSYLAYIRPSRYPRRKSGECLLVRVIEYTIDDPGRPEHAEHHRLITIDETDTHQRLPYHPFRSRTPLGVLQEFYGLLLAHYAIRSIMHESALELDVAPDRLSFICSVRIIRAAVFQAQIVALSQSAEWRQRLLQDIGRQLLPQRANRSNPRVVKRKMSNFDLKRDVHRHWPQPAKSFADAIVLLI